MRLWLRIYFPSATHDPRMFQPAERTYLESARVGRLATVDAQGRPHVVPVCYALLDDYVVTPIDEKPKDVGPDQLRRSRNIRENPAVALVVDHYVEDWSRLGWVQVRATASLSAPDDTERGAAISALREKYDQYHDHELEDRPLIWIDPEHVRSWGRLD